MLLREVLDGSARRAFASKLDAGEWASLKTCSTCRWDKCADVARRVRQSAIGRGANWPGGGAACGLRVDLMAAHRATAGAPSGTVPVGPVQVAAAAQPPERYLCIPRPPDSDSFKDPRRGRDLIYDWRTCGLSTWFDGAGTRDGVTSASSVGCALERSPLDVMRIGVALVPPVLARKCRAGEQPAIRLSLQRQITEEEPKCPSPAICSLAPCPPSPSSPARWPRSPPTARPAVPAPRGRGQRQAGQDRRHPRPLLRAQGDGGDQASARSAGPADGGHQHAHRGDGCAGHRRRGAQHQSLLVSRRHATRRPS